MKKIVSFLLCAAISVTMSVTAFAAENDNHRVTISTTSQPTYTVTIPPTVAIPYNSTEAVSMDISASNVFLNPNYYITVTAKGNGTSNAFTMKNESETLAYELSRSNTNWHTVEPNREVARFTEDGTTKVYIKVPSWEDTMAGEYLGSIIFTIAYDETIA